MGHALEFVQADTLARYWRLMDQEVFFSLGVDEHGQKVAKKADEEGIDRQAYADKFAAEFDNLKALLNLSNDNFIRTTDPSHKAAAQEMWRLCDAKGDIYPKKYKGLYCVGCESFKVDSDLVEGMCPDHGTKPEEIEEENYFFRLSKYQDYLVEYLEKAESIVPDWRREEALTFVKGGLEDLSISREKSRMDWGVPVPNDDEHVMYVWFDALTNYISTLGWPTDESGNFEKYWQNGTTLQLAGKDQVRFQSIIWQAMLESAGIKATGSIFYHGFINSDGKKMSKSIGNVINPLELVDKYGTDGARYIMLRHVHPVDDSDLTWDKMDGYYTDNLEKGLGNLTARVMKMAETHLDAPIDFQYTYEHSPALSACAFQAAADNIWEVIGDMDRYIAKKEPYKIVKTELASGQAMIIGLVEDLYKVATALQPFLPDTAETILAAIKENKKPENLFARLEK